MDIGIPTERRLIPVPNPDLQHSDPLVRRALEAARTHLDTLVTQGDLSEANLALAYGEAGLVYHAHLLFAPAESCYQNASRLAPRDFRWRYYLAYLYQQTGRLEEAAQTYERALELRPQSPQTQLRLGEAYLELSRLHEAEDHLKAAAASKETRGAALFALGRVALVRRDYETAVAYLTDALQVSPEASRAHLSLAMAYRELNDLQQAREQLAKRGDVKPTVADPLIEALNRRSTGQRALFREAFSAVRRGEYGLAVQVLTDGLSRDPENVNARVSLARALYLSGDRVAARRELEEALRQEPKQTLASFLLGVLAMEAGANETAAEYFRKTLDYEPDHAGAHYYTASLLMASANYAEAAQHYGIVVKQSPDHALARLGEVLALIRTRAAHARIKDRLERAVQMEPEDTVLAYLLARLLAASSDPRVRDGGRALALGRWLYEKNPLPEHAEVVAMAYAAKGKFRDAVVSQEKAISMAELYRLDLLPRLEGDLARYRDGLPCREPWPAHDPGMGPPPADAVRAFRSYPTDTPY